MKFFLLWAEERDLKQASQITRPILESYQRSLWRYTQPNGKRLGWTSQRSRLGTIKDFFRWLTKQDILMHNPASELEMPRMEKRLPGEALSLDEVERLLAVPDVSDPLGIRDRAMLELFYSTGMRRAELCRLDLSDLHTERRTVHIRKGKGKKDRMVPIGQRAAFWVERYLQETRPRLCLDTRTQALFLTGYGGPFNPDVLSRMVTEWVGEGGTAQEREAAICSGTPAPRTCLKAGRTSATSSSCLGMRSSTPPPFTPKSASNSCRKSTPAATPPPSLKPRQRPSRRPQNRPKILLPRPRPNDTVWAWKREQPVPSVF